MPNEEQRKPGVLLGGLKVKANQRPSFSEPGNLERSTSFSARKALFWISLEPRKGKNHLKRKQSHRVQRSGERNSGPTKKRRIDIPEIQSDWK